VILATCVTAAAAPSAKDILKTAGVKGGLVVHLGCGDGKLTAALHANGSYIVHGLDADPANVAAARETVCKAGLYGKVSVMRWTGASLPYADNLVNLLVADDLGKVPMGEVMRVLVPDGVAVVGGKSKVKPHPKDIDEWTHFLHDASNDCTARDARVGPPKRMKWVCGPLWTRSHEYTSSMVQMISAGGRIVYLFDEGLTGVTPPTLPERWTLTARDAFNGVLLWKRRLDNWRAGAWGNKSLRGIPPSVPRLLVAEGDRVFTPLTLAAPVSILDAATGRTLATCEGTDKPQELRCSGGVLLVRTARKGILAFDTANGKKLWDKQDNIRPLTLAAQNGRVFYQVGAAVTCLDLKTGGQLWKTQAPAPPKPPAKKRRRAPASLVVACGDVVLFNATKGMTAVLAETGKAMWSGKGRLGREPIIAQGKLWQRQGNRVVAVDLKTGNPAGQVSAADVFTPGHHARCYQSKATEKYVITPNRGVEFISLTGEPNTQHDWARGPCRYGIMPSNGLLYVPPNPCFCFPGVKITGLNALEAGPNTKAPESKPAQRLVKGPAYGQIENRKSKIDNQQGWPTYRHDARRTGGTVCKVPPKVAEQWTVSLKGRLTPPVAVGGRLYVAARDAHTLHALKAADGSSAWRFIAGGRIDSPPTIHGGTVLFGCADGYVYCLRASDGKLAWRFRAAPRDRLIVSFSQLESAWRVHGSVLVTGGIAYCTAGRSTYLDGGIRVIALDPATGKLMHETVLDTWARTREDAKGKPFIPGYHIEGSHSDILVSEGGYIYMGQYKLDRSLKEQDVPYLLIDPKNKSGAMGLEELTGKPYVQDMGTQKRDEVVQRNWQLRVWPKLAKEHAEKYGASNLGERKMGRHVFATGSFLDDAWYNRTFWMYSETWPGFHIANRGAKTGQLLSVDGSKTYAVQAYPRRNLQSPLFTPGKDGYLLFADDNDNEPIIPDYTRGVPKGIGFTRKNPPVWFNWVPLRIRAMVVTDSALFAAGPPDVLDSNDPMASFDGRKGALLWAFSKKDGKKLAEYKLDFPPVFDGMIAAGGRLYVVTIDGSVRCYATKK